MFRKMRRIRQALSDDVSRGILMKGTHGVLALSGDNGYPYALPINFYFDSASCRIYFHSGRVGHKLDAIAKSDKVSFCVYDKGYTKDGHWSLNIRSVIVFGRIHTVESWSDELMVNFSKKFTEDIDYIHNEIESFRNNTAVLCLEIEHMTGKLVNEA